MSSGASSGGRKSSRGGNSSGGRGRGRGGRRGGRGRSNSNSRRQNNSSNSNNNRGSSNGDNRGSKSDASKLPEMRDEVSENERGMNCHCLKMSNLRIEHTARSFLTSCGCVFIPSL